MSRLNYNLSCLSLTGQKFILLALAFAFASFLVTPTLIHAQHPQAATLDEKPMFNAKMQFLTPWYIQSKKGAIDQRMPEVKALLEKMAAGDPGAIDPYDMGTTSAEAAKNFLYDLQEMSSNFMQCAEPMVVGICWKMTTFGPAFGPFMSYFMAKMKAENVDNYGKSGHYVDSLQESMRAIADNPDNPISHYHQVPERIGEEVNATQNISNWYIDRYFNTFLPNASPRDSSGNKQRAKDAVQAIRDNFTIDQRFKNTSTGAMMINEYHIMPTWFEEFLDLIPGLQVAFPRYHIKKPVGFWNSDWPMMKLPATFGMFSYFLFPFEMMELYGAPGSGVGAFPLSCAGYNMRKGMQHNPMGVHSTPLDMLRLSVDPAGFNARLLSSPGFGCLGYNQGNWVPVTAAINQGYGAPAAAVGTVKGIKVAARMNPLQFYDGTFKNDAKYPDKVQWGKSDAVRDATGGKCIKPEQFNSVYGKGLEKQHPINDHAHWHMTYHWKYFRVCPTGMKPLVAWSGDHTTIYE